MNFRPEIGKISTTSPFIQRENKCLIFCWFQGSKCPLLSPPVNILGFKASKLTVPSKCGFHWTCEGIPSASPTLDQRLRIRELSPINERGSDTKLRSAIVRRDLRVRVLLIVRQFITGRRQGKQGGRGWWKYTRAYPITDLPLDPRERIGSSATATAAEAAAVPGAKDSGSHAAASAAAAAAATVEAVDSSRWITRRRGWRLSHRRARRQRGDETRGCQLADLHNMISSRFVSSRRSSTSTDQLLFDIRKRERKREG